MKMKRKCLLPIMMAVVIMLAAVGCSSQNNTQAEPENTEEAEASEQSTLTGTLDEIKDFMFVVTDSEGTSYAFPFEGEKPSGLEDLESGDEVIVTYTGELSEVDNFEGEIISIEKVK